ncbi:hypothetical protein ORIO_06215 [Cereibacter azotoformans]|uniref:Head decoration protein n=1 Tax=Cereibacter sphaeroides (strain ATCC 17025 / ATH 2.4.3) TaxID=349102 RepID=A4WS07_CERS5|nr:hypothetical protein [Cereibacter azotoformans]AXQ93407.1 hypothetical protein D0Z66_06030 [Cereibacter sphaeroides]MBO4168862.1 hypothetical protein [Cereibacter azotoformans]UIJ31736.1 hypothetical protein LV780_06015 [Cereibacter azotoformans]ULB09521.1 hypothetical protein ORIO_06215 [Cereibacter azotoformans]
MGYLNDRILDLGLTVLTTEANRLDICHTEPATYAQATGTYSLGHKAGLSVGAPAARTPSGRKVTVAAFEDGTVTGTSTSSATDAEFWAITDTVNSRLLAAGPLTTAQYMTADNTFRIAAFDIWLAGLDG